MTNINLYAEVLQNIKQITLYASLTTTKNESTKVDVSSDRRHITVAHEDQSAKLLLPLEIAGTAEVTLPLERAKDISVRLELSDTSAVAPPSEVADHSVPWSAKTFTSTSQIRCVKCENPITKHGVSFSWKDLPSENWAEMMEFWHCHKPHDEDDTDDASSKRNGVPESKGYSMTSRLRVSAGTILVDASNFLVDSADCPGAQVTDKTLPNGYREVECVFCANLVGFEERQTNGWRLYKWSLAVRPDASAEWQSLKLENFITTTLLSLIESQIIRKFVVHAGGHRGTSEGLLLWVFNPDLQYTTSLRPTATAIRAMKVFYQPLHDPDTMLKENSTSLEEIFLPTQVLKGLKKILRESTDMLPPVARKFQDWDVGLLDRFEEHTIDQRN